MKQSDTTLGTAVGVLVVGIALVGTQTLGWEWAGGGLAPTAIGVAAAALAVSLGIRHTLA